MNDDGDRERVLRVERFYEIRASMSEVELYTLELEENSREYRNKDSRGKRKITSRERESQDERVRRRRGRRGRRRQVAERAMNDADVFTADVWGDAINARNHRTGRRRRRASG